jgi:hypothetical protein
MLWFLAFPLLSSTNDSHDNHNTHTKCHLYPRIITNVRIVSTCISVRFVFFSVSQ